MNRFSKDQSVLDDALPRAFGAYLRQLFYVTGIFVVIAYSTPIFLVIILPLGMAATIPIGGCANRPAY